MTVATFAAPAPLLTWNDDLLLGHSGIDHHHAEFVQELQAMHQCDDTQLPTQIGALIAHLEAHFGAENQQMEATAFPPRDCHIKEHAAVLTSVRQIQEMLQTTDAQAMEVAVVRCRELLLALADWFPAHTQHLDSALAHWLVKQQAGGKPVIIKRGLNLR